MTTITEARPASPPIPIKPLSPAKQPQPLVYKEPILVIVLKENGKDVLRTIRYSFEWARSLFQSLKSSIPIKNLLNVTNIGEHLYGFSDFLISSIKMIYTITIATKNGIKKTIKDLVRRILDLTWNTFKLCKMLFSYKIVNFSSNFIKRFSVLGGMSFAIFSGERIMLCKKALDKIAKESIPNKNASTLYLLFDLSKNVGTCAVGIIVALGGLIGYTATPWMFLLLGTEMLISNYGASFFYHLQKK